MQTNANNLSHCESDHLLPGHTLLYGQYKIERHLIGGGFGMTYLARDSLDRIVVIKECFPSTMCRRVDSSVRPHKADFQEQFQKIIRSFLREALRMAKFDHPHIVKVHQVFQENNTAYIAMDFVDGMDLLTMLEVDPGRINEALIESFLHETLSALNYVHGMGMLHRDISPDNLLVDANNKLTIIDFGAAREETARQTRVLSHFMAVKDGYSPHEFYYTDGDQGPSSDIYSVGATFYHLITGNAPPDCQKRVAALTSDMPDPYQPLATGNWPFDKSFLRAIDTALCVAQKDRFQSAEAWLDALNNPQEASTLQPELSCAGVASQDANATAANVTSPPVHQKAAEPESELAQKISSLVQETNTKVQPGKPGVAKQQVNPEPEVEKECAPLVDIFGQPIDDLEKWLKEQDAKQKRGRGRALQEMSAAPTRKADSESSLFGLLSVFRKFSRVTGGSVA